MCVDDRLHTVQQRWDALNLVDENGSSGWWRRIELCLEPLRLGDVLAKRREARQVERDVRVERAQQRRFPYLPRAQQKDRMAIRRQPRRDEPVIHVGKIPSFLPTSKK